MITVWRITKSQMMQDAFSGEGARLWGGRWNGKGVPVIYTAASRSLAILEILVHLRGARQSSPLTPFLLYPASFDESLVEILANDSVPSGWDDEPATSASKLFGDRWVTEARSVVLSVPSAIVPSERNYILNPRHPMYPRVSIGASEPCRIDPRLL